MPHYSALFVQRRSTVPNSGPVFWESAAPALRVPVVTNYTSIQDTPGGYISASFTINPEHNRIGVLPRNTQAWIFDGLTEAFMGYVDKSVPVQGGGQAVTLTGAYGLLARTRMRSVWQDADLTQMRPSPGNVRHGSMNVDASGNLLLSFARDHEADSGDYVGADYFLFDEASGTRDTKKLTGWAITIGDAGTKDFTGNVNFDVRVYGLTDPGDASPTLLHTFTTNSVTRNETADGLHGGDNVSAWGSATGYRCFSVRLRAKSNTVALAQDRIVKITAFGVSTAGLRLNQDVNPDTTDIVSDVFVQGGPTYDVHALLQEENTSGTSQTMVGNIVDSGISAPGTAFTAWSSPQEIIDAMQAVDGYMVGMWGPTRRPPGSAYACAAGNTGLQWKHRQPPELIYAAWADPKTPDYVIRTLRGALWEPDDQADELVEATYANYQTLRGQDVSVFVQDTDQKNSLFLQGWHEAVDWSIDTPVAGGTATSLAGQYNTTRRTPFLAGTMTVYGDRVGSIEVTGGVRLPLLSALRPGVCKVADTTGPQVGRVTTIEYSARTGGEPEKAVLTVNSPAAGTLDRRLARIARKAALQRLR